jgi:hypothetical protein
MTERLRIDETRFNNDAYIEAVVAAAPAKDQRTLRTALAYLYKDDGPINLPRPTLLRVRQLLDAGERTVIQWLYTRTNGNPRKSYGAQALRAARSSRYRCSECQFDDVRVLNLDHVEGRVAGTPFACLCANCHTIKSREKDWTGKRRAPI